MNVNISDKRTGTILVGDLVAEFLQRLDVTTAFGVVSVHNIPMLDAIGRRNSLRFVMGRGEAGAGHMADAYARVSGELGVLFTSTGPGAANAAGAIVEANFAGTPMLHLTGQTATAHLDKGQRPVHDVPNQLGMLESIGKAAFRIRSPETAFGTLVQAATAALTPPTGPVSVEIPIDVQRTAIPRPAGLETLQLPVPIPDPGPSAALDAIAKQVAAAKRPLLWTGNGAKFSKPAVARLVELGIPLLTSWNGRGVMPENHPMVLGPMATMKEVRTFMESADLLLISGCRLRGHETGDMSMVLPSPRIQIDVDAAAEGRTYPSDMFLCADAGAALGALADRLEGKSLSVESGIAREVADVKERARESYVEFLGAYGSFPAQMRAAMPDDAVWVRDITLNNSTWGNRIFPLNDPRNNVYPIGAAIGPGLPLGIGAALGAGGRKVVSMSGDGGFCLSLAELWTAVQEQADIVFVVMNDRGYGVIRHIQDALYGERNYYDKLLAPDLAAVSISAGVGYTKVDKADGLEAAVAEALTQPGPSIVEVEMTAIGPYPRFFKAPPADAKNTSVPQRD